MDYFGAEPVVVQCSQRKKIVVHNETENRNHKPHNDDGNQDERIPLSACTKNHNLVVGDHASKAHKKAKQSGKRCGLGDNCRKTVNNKTDHLRHRNSLLQDGLRKKKYLIYEKHHKKKEKADEKIKEQFLRNVFQKQMRGKL